MGPVSVVPLVPPTGVDTAEPMNESEVLEQTAEWLSRLAETIERITERMADSIAKVQSEQERQADEIRALSNRIEALHRNASHAPIAPLPRDRR